MSTLNISETELNQLIEMKDQGRIAEAWNLLGAKGDAYAFLAGAIVSDNVADMPPLARMFYEMVRSQWENSVGAGVWGGEVFQDVGKRHLENYLTLLGSRGGSGAYVLPTTKEIEASYKEALGRSGLPPITAIDSLFSVLDLAAGDGQRSLPEDFSWAQVMNLANGLMGGPAWQADRIEFNSEVFRDDVDPIMAVVTLGRTVVNSAERFGAGLLASMSVFAPSYWAFKLVDGVLDYTLV